MTGRVLTAIALLMSGGAQAQWQVVTADPMAMARIEVAQPKGRDQPALLEIGCLRGTSTDVFTLRAELRIPRAASGLPVDMTRRERRLGRTCPGPITTAISVPRPAPIRLRIGRETVETRASVGPAFLESERPVEAREEPPCEIAVHALDPDEAQLVVEGLGETKTRYVVELARAEHEGEIVLEAPEHGAVQAFPLAGAASALSRIREFCGW